MHVVNHALERVAELFFARIGTDGQVGLV